MGAGLNYWEAGMDIHPSNNLYDSFIDYQSELILMFDQFTKELWRLSPLTLVDPCWKSFGDLQNHIRQLIRRPATYPG